METKQDSIIKQYNKVMKLYGDNNINETYDQVKIMLDMASVENNHYYYAVGLNFLGALQTTMGNDNRALDYYFEAMIFAEKYQVTEFLPVVYNNIGARYMDASAYDEALIYLKKAEEILDVQEPSEHVSQEIKDNRSLINYMNMALSNTYLKDYLYSNHYLKKAKPLIYNSKLDLDFTYDLVICQNDYYLGNRDHLKDRLRQLLDQILKLDSLYNYKNNISDMFNFLNELREEKKLKQLLNIVQQFVDEHNDSGFETLLCQMKIDYEKQYGTKEAYQACCVELSHIYKEQELKAVEQRREYMTLKLEMRKAEAQRNEEEKKQQKLLGDALENAKNASIAKSQFLSGMSHELRTPLNAVIGYLSIAKETDDIEKVSNCIENGEVAAKQLLQIINNVLDMSSIESGRMKIDQEEFDLKDEILDITTIFYQNTKVKEVNFEAQIEQLSNEWIIGDQLRLKQVLINLLSNAVKFTPKDGLVKLVVKQLTLDEDTKDCYIQFEVSDTGIGMSEEYLGRIFNPFEQEHANTARKYGGSGLGLSITHNLINMMGGTIDVKSKQGKGTTFIVVMPFVKSSNNSIQINQTSFVNKRCLIVENNKDEGRYIKQLLKNCGIKSDIVTSGHDALKRIHSRSGSDYAYDICIFDSKLHNFDIQQLIVKSKEYATNNPPLMIASTYDKTEVDIEGVDGIIRKPLFRSTLVELLETVFVIGETNDKPQLDNTRDFNGVRVLLAEDNEMNMDIAATILEKAGVIVDQVTDGQQAYDKFISSIAGSYDLILMDVQMPVMDGYQATQKIRASSHIEAKTIPIVAMTANAFTEDISEALSKGMNAHIAKPINYEKMFELINQFTNKLEN